MVKLTKQLDTYKIAKHDLHGGNICCLFLLHNHLFFEVYVPIFTIQIELLRHLCPPSIKVTDCDPVVID